VSGPENESAADITAEESGRGDVNAETENGDLNAESSNGGQSAPKPPTGPESAEPAGRQELPTDDHTGGGAESPGSNARVEGNGNPVGTMEDTPGLTDMNEAGEAGQETAQSNDAGQQQQATESGAETSEKVGGPETTSGQSEPYSPDGGFPDPSSIQVENAIDSYSERGSVEVAGILRPSTLAAAPHDMVINVANGTVDQIDGFDTSKLTSSQAQNVASKMAVDEFQQDTSFVEIVTGMKEAGETEKLTALRDILEYTQTSIANGEDVLRGRLAANDVATLKNFTEKNLTLAQNQQ
jgi:hypothetical protein